MIYLRYLFGAVLILSSFFLAHAGVLAAFAVHAEPSVALAAFGGILFLAGYTAAITGYIMVRNLRGERVYRFATYLILLWFPALHLFFFIVLLIAGDPESDLHPILTSLGIGIVGFTLLVVFHRRVAKAAEP